MTIRSAYPTQVKIVEVGPRDGLQNFPTPLGLPQRIRFADLLSECGFQEIECAAHVSPLWVPQMAAARSLLVSIHRNPQTLYTALVPNERGMREALQARASKIAVFTAASETFNKKNINATIEESIERFAPVLKIANEHGVPYRAYVSTAFHCPDEGKISPDQVLDVVRRLEALGFQDISIGDTIGKANPDEVRALLDVLLARFPKEFFGMHFHDTFGNALENVRASLEYGISIFDSSAGGVGGCPYAKGAKGNVATGDLVRLFDSLGIYSGIDLQKLLIAEQYLSAATLAAQQKDRPDTFVAALANKKLQRHMMALIRLIQIQVDLKEMLKSRFDNLDDSPEKEIIAADLGELLGLLNSEFRKLHATAPEDIKLWLKGFGVVMKPGQQLDTNEIISAYLKPSK